ncbi:MAG: ferrous iron transport protein B [Planctomycetota bacterium]
MTTTDIARAPRVALAGNPNAGKTSLFNWLTGSSQKVGNYPGITVERHSGKLKLPDGKTVEVFDIPGTYSLSARSAEEQIAAQTIVGLPPHAAPDLVVVVVDSTQLLRNLYLALQVVETGTPVVIALTMLDLLEKSGQRVDTGALSEALGIEVIPVSGLKGTGVGELNKAIERSLSAPESPKLLALEGVGAELESDLLAVGRGLPESWNSNSPARTRALAAWALLSIDKDDELSAIPEDLRSLVLARQAAATQANRDLDLEITAGRYAWIDSHCAASLIKIKDEPRSLTSRIDAVLLNPIVGPLVFLVAMAMVFQSLFSWADPAIGLCESFFGSISEIVISIMPASTLRDFITEGLIAGAGGTFVFLPQILLLFLFIGLMEDSGYLARVASLMDRLMRLAGLHGRAFVPMLSGYACAIPAIMATRTMERKRDRMVTMMVVPLISCSARLPVYSLIIAALFDSETHYLGGLLSTQGLLMVLMYLFSTVVAILAAAVLGRTLLKGPPVPPVMEMPPYRLPQWRAVIRMMWSRAFIFIREAGPVIVGSTIVLWALLSFPKEPELSTDYDSMRTAAELQHAGVELESQLALIDNEEAGDVFRNSYGARMGKALEPTIEPLGFDWKIGIGLIGAFAAREVFVSTMGVVYGVSADVDEESETLREKIRNERWPDGRAVYTPLVGLSLMVFIALACQCMSTLAAVYRETASWRWPLFMFTYMTALAWVASLLVYQGGRLLGYE